MSMNVHAETLDRQDITLWQTPTWFSYICVYNRKGKRRKWKEARYIYLEWIKGKLNGAWTDDEYEEMNKNVKEHIEYVMSFKKLKFYVM